MKSFNMLSISLIIKLSIGAYGVGDLDLDSNPHAQAAKPIAGTLSIYQFVRTNNSK
jgi:hypothetical protein